jgi:hypothetical protein
MFGVAGLNLFQNGEQPALLVMVVEDQLGDVDAFPSLDRHWMHNRPGLDRGLPNAREPVSFGERCRCCTWSAARLVRWRCRDR